MVKKNKEQIEHTSVSSGSKSLKTSSLKIQKSLKPKKAQLSSSQKKRVLHIAGSGTSKYYESVSLIYGVPSFVHGPREEFEHVFAKVSIDDKEKTGRAKWQFNASVPKSVDQATEDVNEADKLDSDQAIAHIVSKIDADVIVPHMFCYQGYTCFRSIFDMLNIPYIGTAAEMQGLLCDKWMTRGIMQQDGVRVAKGQLLKRNDPALVHLKCPVIVKPAREDNSIGVTHVKNREMLQGALDKAFESDDHVIVEDYIPGREIRVAVVPQRVIDNIDAPLDAELPNTESDELVVLPFLEYLFMGKAEIRDSDSKLNHDENGIPQKQNQNTFGATKLPASLSPELADEISTQAKRAFLAMDGRHYSVFDFRVMQDEKSGKEIPYFLEACSSAGFSPQSIIVRMANHSSQCGGPDLTHPRLFQGVLKTAIRESAKYKSAQDSNTQGGMQTKGLRKS